MTASFFEKPILNSPYGYPRQHRELDEIGQPTNRIIEARRRSDFMTSISDAKVEKSASNVSLRTKHSEETLG